MNYIKPSIRQPNTFYYKTVSGQIKSHPNNTTYVHKKPQAGCINGTSLTTQQLQDILKQRTEGTKLKDLQAEYNITRYYLNKALKYAL